ncbi:lysophospholipid acyltransferase family protein [Microbacter margulisiae]|uniref:1-acyl-sn-glycerol-3-phosphate acyltransferase n=1 Tax=Microbacter margulisiae TaxID=1350067 RepID=A0A7W5DS81_9PORP|nr:lysophospholipid acyltransferase family protein [Microbacter margulisiae]MBB3187644.1 1-acyl-sn-glycerol-3-phosphate acyltransferase [Microbacter margulisiae]
MQRIISIPLSLIAYLLFFFFICLFHPIQYLCLHLFGYEAHKRSVDLLNFCLLQILWVTFTTAKAEFKAQLPEGKPLIFVANHQGLYDIIGIGWFMRKYHPKYVSKVELGKGIPSVSYNLNHGGSVLIDRKDPKQALPALKKMAEYIQANNRSTVIYPEGTRSRDGKPGTFAANGLKILCKYAPDAWVVPVTINNSWKVFRYGGFLLGLGNRLKFTVHPPLAVKEYDFNTLFEKTRDAIVSEIEH